LTQFLALDIGNSSLKYACFVDGERFETERLPLDADLEQLPSAERIVAVSVNPPTLERVRAARPALEVVGEALAVPLQAYGGCGPDRILAAAGALHRRPEATGVCVLEAGTCLTATVAVRGRGVLGGAILPGPDLMARSLAEGTQTLPLVTPGPGERIGRSTEEAIRAGIRAAVEGGARELIARCREATDEPLEVVAAGTGGPALAGPEITATVRWATLWGVYCAALR